MRLYSFVNGLYLRPIQHGIQTAHLVHDLFIKYQTVHRKDAGRVLYDWARDHKTIIILDASPMANVEATYRSLIELGPKLKLPYEYFKEDEESLGGIMTCCGIVVPERLYNAVPGKVAGEMLNLWFPEEEYIYIHENGTDYNTLDADEAALVALIKSKRLAS